ncbi:MAG: membrane dipeptidase [Pelotomaculum sp.]|nr:membrane dipeptidase [Pelotomaculum sp.]
MKYNPAFRAALLHQESIVVDAHCDTLTVLLERQKRLSSCSDGHLDLPRLKTGGVDLQFFAAFISPEYRSRPVERALDLIGCFYREIEDNKDLIMHVRNQNEVDLAFASGKIAALLSVEGGEALGGSLGTLRMLYGLGVRCLTLTWNGRNELGCGAGEGGAESGLTEFGRAVVREMNRLGMLVDVSHLSEKGFWEVMKLTKQPVIASHSNCMALCSHPRNLSDRQIRALAEQGGVVGITFVPAFLGSGHSSVNNVLDHIEYAISVGGVECVGLGSDFDGTEELPEGLEDCTCFPAIANGLIKRGYSSEAVKKVMGENFLRVIGQVLK